MKSKQLTKNYHWFFTDMVDASDPISFIDEQIEKILFLNKLIKKTKTFSKLKANLDPVLTTGDGMVVGFQDSPEKPLLLAKEIHNILSQVNRRRKAKDRINIRIGLSTGPVYQIKDILGNNFFWGSGIIMAKRVMDLGNSMHVLATENIADEINKISKTYEKNIHFVGNFSTKHGEPLLVYNLFGKGWGNKSSPQTRLKRRIQDFNPFSNPYVEIKLDVRNSKSMLVHHTWIWEEKNISNKPIELIPCIIEGPISRKLSDVHVALSDERKNRHEIETIVEDNPYQKHLVFLLKKPIKPKHARRIKLEYDWELPDRKYEYILTSDCKLFKYQLTIPKGVEIISKVFRFDPVTKLKELASPSPKIKYHKNKTIMTWQATNLHSHEGYRFHW